MAKAQEVYEAFTDYLVKALKEQPTEKDVEAAERFLRNAKVEEPDDVGDNVNRTVLNMSKHRARLEAADG